MRRSIKLVKQSGLTTLAMITLIVALLYVAQVVLIPLALAVLFCFLLAPVAKWLERIGFGRVFSTIIVVTLGFGLLTALGWVVGHQVYALGQDFPKYESEVQKKAAKLRLTFGKPLAGVTHAIEQVSAPSTAPSTQPTSQPASQPSVTSRVLNEVKEEATGQHDEPLGSQANPMWTQPVSAPISPLGYIADYLGALLSPLGTAGIVIVFVIFMLLEREDLRDRGIRLIARGKYTVTTKALDDAASRISRYLLAQTIVNSTYGVIIAGGLWGIGHFFGGGISFPSVALWGLLCMVLRFVPYIGPWIAAAFPVALSLIVFPGFTVFAMTAGLFVFVELLSNNLMEPWLYGSSTGLSTLAILVAAVFWTWLWGAVGLLLSTPLTVCIVVLGKYVPQLHFLDVMLGDQPALPPDVSFYQRVLAGDKREAASIVDAYSKEKGAEHAGDDVIIPALRLARRDRADSQLSPEDESTFYETVKGAIAEWEKKLNDAAAKSDAKATSAAVSAADAATSAAPAPPPAPITPSALIIGCPSHHRSEELTLDMLCVLMKLAGSRVDVVPTRTLPVEIEQTIRESAPQAIFIAILPPGGIVQARYLCRRLRRRFPDTKIVIGYWGRARNFDRLLVRLRSAGASSVTTSLLQSRNQLNSIVAPAKPVESTS